MCGMRVGSGGVGRFPLGQEIFNRSTHDLMMALTTSPILDFRHAGSGQSVEDSRAHRGIIARALGIEPGDRAISRAKLTRYKIGAGTGIGGCRP